MFRILVLVPFPLDEKGVANRQAQLGELKLNPDTEFRFMPVKAGPDWLDSPHDWVLGDMSMFEAGLRAQEDGYDAVCIDTMSDSGVTALRSVLDIPVIGPARASYLTALMLGDHFSILTVWDPWIRAYRKTLVEAGLVDKCASIRSTGEDVPDVTNLLAGKEEEAFPKLETLGWECIKDGAEVICLGSTTMHQSHKYLSSKLPVPVINPGPLTYKLAESLLGLGLTQSRVCYPRPRSPKARLVERMLDAAASAES